MEQTKGQIRALDILKRSEAGEPRADIAKSYGVSESSIYFETRFGRFLRYRDQHPDDRAAIGAWGSFDKAWSKTDKKAPEQTRFAELICALPLATDALPAKAPRKPSKTPAPTPIAAAQAPTPEPAPEPAPEAPFPNPSEHALELGRARDARYASEDEPAPEAPIAPPALDPVAAKRERKTIAQRLRRAAAKAKVQWRGDSEMTAAAQ